MRIASLGASTSGRVLKAQEIINCLDDEYTELPINHRMGQSQWYHRNLITQLPCCTREGNRGPAPGGHSGGVRD